jgi:hypothetical protein
MSSGATTTITNPKQFAAGYKETESNNQLNEEYCVRESCILWMLIVYPMRWFFAE